jgi:hypothetical protein
MSGIVGMLPCKLFEEDANGGKTPIKTDPRYKLIRRRVSPEISAASFLLFAVAFVIFHHSLLAWVKKRSSEAECLTS